MKRNFTIALFTGILTLAALGMTACTQDTEPSQSVPNSSSTEAAQASATVDLLEQIRERGEIIIATEGTWSPWTYHDENDVLVGFDVEVAQKVAEKLGVKATFVEAKWDGIFAGLDSERYDIVANGVEITDERAAKYDFSDPYAYIRTVVIVNGDNNEINSFEDLNGKRTANTLASTYAVLAEGYGAEAVGVDDLNQTMEMLLANRVDATLNAEVSYYDYMKAHPDANLKIATQTEEGARVSFPVRKNENTASLLSSINKAIVELYESGEIAELSVKYFGNDISKAE